MLEQVGDGVLGDAPHPPGDEVGDHQPDPGAEREPELGDPGPVGQPGAAEQRSGADPGADERAHQQQHGHRAAGDHEVGVALHRARAPQAHGDEHEGIGEHHHNQQVHDRPPE